MESMTPAPQKVERTSHDGEAPLPESTISTFLVISAFMPPAGFAIGIWLLMKGDERGRWCLRLAALMTIIIAIAYDVIESQS